MSIRTKTPRLHFLICTVIVTLLFIADITAQTSSLVNFQRIHGFPSFEQPLNADVSPWDDEMVYAGGISACAVSIDERSFTLIDSYKYGPIGGGFSQFTNVDLMNDGNYRFSSSTRGVPNFGSITPFTTIQEIYDVKTTTDLLSGCNQSSLPLQSISRAMNIYTPNFIDTMINNVITHPFNQIGRHPMEFDILCSQSYLKKVNNDTSNSSITLENLTSLGFTHNIQIYNYLGQYQYC